MRGQIKPGSRTEKLEHIRAVARLRQVIIETERANPLPRCVHAKPLKDGAGEILEPPCGCRWPSDYDRSR